MAKTFYIGVKGVLVKNNSALVLTKIDQEGNKFWDIPGGRIDESETIEQALKRELEEEIPTIPDFKTTKLLNAYRLERDLKDGQGLFLIFYKVEVQEFEVKLSDEHMDYKWIQLSDLDELVQDEDIYINSGYLEAIKLALV